MLFYHKTILFIQVFFTHLIYPLICSKIDHFTTYYFPAPDVTFF